MSLHELTERTRPERTRGLPCVVLVPGDGRHLRACLKSVLTHTTLDVPIVLVSDEPATTLGDLLDDCGAGERSVWLASGSPASASGDGQVRTAVVERVFSLLWPADVALLSEPCRVTAGWLKRMREAARSDTNSASASALADAGTALALSRGDNPSRDLRELAGSVPEHTLRLRPRLSLIVGPCVYLRRDALELVGPLDETLALSWAVEVDLAQRCLLAGLGHVAADDVVVGRLAPARDIIEELPEHLRERYPHLRESWTATGAQDDPPPSDDARIAASGVLLRALEAARRPRSQLWVTIDARALSTTLTGTQRHILELIRALADTGTLRLRLLVSSDTSAANVELMRSLPQTELLPIGSIDANTPRSTIFHRPQQAFGSLDMRLALRLGERIVLNQLDLIAYRNPGYHANPTAWRSHRRVSRQALAAADRVVVFSDHTREELLSDELVERDRIRIVPPGLDHPWHDAGRRPAVLNAPPDSRSGDRESAEGFLLCLGTDFRHKNRVFALRLLAALRERHGWEGRLVLAGTHIPNGSSHELELSFLEEHPQFGPAVVELGAIDEEEKSWLMSHADAVVYPSVYEGFGLVPFEAGFSGVPCVFAPQSSLAGVLPGEQAAIVPWSPNDSADAAYPLLRDPTARARHVEALVEAGRRLTWAKAAAAMVNVYDEAAIAPVREATTLSRDEVAREHELRELVAAQDAHVARLVEEREHARGMYDALNAEVGSGLSLIGPRGALPEELQRGLLALSARPALSRPLYGLGAHLFGAAQAVVRRLRGGARGGN